LIPADKGYGFPSGHAVIVSAGAAVTLALFRGTPRKLAVSIILAIETALGHYPLDVIGGILQGVGVSFIFVGTEKHIESVLISIRHIVRR
jgi:membrane-associated phospholipid phosphatase